MDQRYVEGKSGSRVRPPRYGVPPSCSPLWRRYRHDCSAGNAGPWRRLYNIPERAWAGPGPAVRGQRGHQLLPGPRPRGGFGRRLRPVGPVAASRGGSRRGSGRAGDATPGRRGLFRTRLGGRTDGRVHPSGHTPGHPRALCRTPVGPALAGLAAADGRRAGLAGHGDASVANARRRTGPGPVTQRTKHGGGPCARGRSTRLTALPHTQPALGPEAESRGGEP